MKKDDHWMGVGIGTGMGIGMPIGLIIGIILDNIALGISIGPALGVGFGTAIGAYLKKKHQDEDIPPEKLGTPKKKLQLELFYYWYF